MQTLTATYRIVTPMFLGGADPAAEAELRLSSFKGALRFWWRALMWGKVRDIMDLRHKESELFGSSQLEHGQSKVIWAMESRPTAPLIAAGAILGADGQQANRGSRAVGEGARYLGYGLMEIGGRLTRPCLPAPQEIRLRACFRAEATPEQRAQVEAAVRVLGLFGGLGSRSRRGYGSLTLRSLEVAGETQWRSPATMEQWDDCLRETVGKAEGNGLPGWTAFSSGHSRLLLLSGDHETPLDLLARLGRDFVFYRSWGKNGRVLGSPGEENFRDDHDLMRPKRVPNPRTHPRRVVFGLPHNYGKRPEEQVGPADPELDRRASPLFFHIHQPSAETSPVGILLFLPSRFLPRGRDAISVGGIHVPLAHGGDGSFWKPALDFLDRLSAGSGKEKFRAARLICL